MPCYGCKTVLIALVVVVVVVNHALYKTKVIKLFRSNEKKIILYVANKISNNLRALHLNINIARERVHFKNVKRIRMQSLKFSCKFNL